MAMTSESIMSEMPSHADVADHPDEVALFREERSHQMFPDEIDTPMHAPARIRLVTSCSFVVNMFGEY